MEEYGKRQKRNAEVPVMSNPENPEHDPVELTVDVDGVPAGTICHVTARFDHHNIVVEAFVGGSKRSLAVKAGQYSVGATKPITYEDEKLQPA